jgi:hypothetical protein
MWGSLSEEVFENNVVFRFFDSRTDPFFDLRLRQCWLQNHDSFEKAALRKLRARTPRRVAHSEG